MFNLTPSSRWQPVLNRKMFPRFIGPDESIIWLSRPQPLSLSTPTPRCFLQLKVGQLGAAAGRLLGLMLQTDTNLIVVEALEGLRVHPLHSHSQRLTFVAPIHWDFQAQEGICVVDFLAHCSSHGCFDWIVFTTWYTEWILQLLDLPKKHIGLCFQSWMKYVVSQLNWIWVIWITNKYPSLSVSSEWYHLLLSTSGSAVTKFSLYSSCFHGYNSYSVV